MFEPRLLFSLLLVASQCSAGELKPFGFTPDEKPKVAAHQVPSCKIPDLKLPINFAVYAAGGYSGRKLAFQIDQTGHQATQIDVAANSPGRPVVLLLAAYEPTIWNVGWSEKTNILAVFVSGYHRQVVAGLNKSTPVFSNTHDSRGPCGFFIASGDNLDTMNPLSMGLFGRPFDKAFSAENGKVVVGEPIAAATRLLTSSDVTPDSFQDKSAPLAGPPALQDAVSKGLLRKATQADLEAWSAASGKPQKPESLNAYVVLKAFAFPNGLYGAHAASFLVPKGVPKPEGNPGHSAVYDFNTLNCQGALCRTR